MIENATRSLRLAFNASGVTPDEGATKNRG